MGNESIKMKSEIVEAFKIVVYKNKINFDNNKLLNYILNIKNKQKSRERSNKGGWQSDNLDLNETIIDNLIKNFSPSILEFLKILEFNSNKTSVVNLWANINGFKDFNLTHTHPGCFISGAYYIQVPENSGSIVFHNPSEDMMSADWNSDQNIKYNSYNGLTYWIKPETSYLYLFPSWLKHHVEPNLSKKNRVSISFNVVL